MAKRSKSRQGAEERRLARTRRLIAGAAIVVVAAVVALGVFMASRPTELGLEEGRTFRTVEGAFVAGPITVTEFFSYGCLACAEFEPRLADWVESLPDDVEFQTVPFTGNPAWDVYARGHFAMKDMGLLEAFHSELFDTISVRGKSLRTDESFADHVAPGAGEAFVRSMNGLRVERAMRRADQLARSLGVISVPTLVVDGRYVVIGQGASVDALRVAEMLIDRARQER